jgi:hypothetical protein
MERCQRWRGGVAAYQPPRDISVGDPQAPPTRSCRYRLAEGHPTSRPGRGVVVGVERIGDLRSPAGREQLMELLSPDIPSTSPFRCLGGSVVYLPRPIRGHTGIRVMRRISKRRALVASGDPSTTRGGSRPSLRMTGTSVGAQCYEHSLLSFPPDEPIKQ